MMKKRGRLGRILGGMPRARHGVGSPDPQSTEHRHQKDHLLSRAKNDDRNIATPTALLCRPQKNLHSKPKELAMLDFYFFVLMLLNSLKMKLPGVVAMLENIE